MTRDRRGKPQKSPKDESLQQPLLLGEWTTDSLQYLPKLVDALDPGVCFAILDYFEHLPETTGLHSHAPDSQESEPPFSAQTFKLTCQGYP